MGLYTCAYRARELGACACDPIENRFWSLHYKLHVGSVWCPEFVGHGPSAHHKGPDWCVSSARFSARTQFPTDHTSMLFPLYIHRETERRRFSSCAAPHAE